MVNGKFFNLKKKDREAQEELARLNSEMAAKLILLATETGDKAHLITAVQSLRKADALYTPESTPIENAELQKRLGDVLLKIGKEENDMLALDHAILAYRSAITIASLLGDDHLRSRTREQYNKAKRYRGIKEEKPVFSLMGAA